MQSEEVTVDRFKEVGVDLAEEARGAAEEQTASVIIVTKVVLPLIIFQNVQQEMRPVIFAGKPDITSVRVGDVDWQIGVVMINEDGTDGGLMQDDPEENASNYGSSVGWLTDSEAPAHGWDSDSSTEYVVMSIRRKEEDELRVAGAKLALKINGKATQAWIDSCSPISIFTIGELKRTLGACIVQLKPLDPKDDQFRDYGNNSLRFLGKMQVTLYSNRWTTSAAINVIGGCRPSINGRDLMPALGLMSVQAPSVQRVHSIQSHGSIVETDDDLDDWQKHFSKQFYHLFRRVGRIRNYKVQAEFFKNLVSIQ